MEINRQSARAGTQPGDSTAVADLEKRFKDKASDLLESSDGVAQINPLLLPEVQPQNEIAAVGPGLLSDDLSAGMLKARSDTPVPANSHSLKNSGMQGSDTEKVMPAAGNKQEFSQSGKQAGIVANITGHKKLNGAEEVTAASGVATKASVEMNPGSGTRITAEAATSGSREASTASLDSNKAGETSLDASRNISDRSLAERASKELLNEEARLNKYAEAVSLPLSSSPGVASPLVNESTARLKAEKAGSSALPEHSAEQHSAQSIGKNKLTYAFSEWRQGGQVEVQLGDSKLPHRITPSDNFVQQRLADYEGEQRQKQPQWIFSEQEEHENSRRQTTHDEDDA